MIWHNASHAPVKVSFWVADKFGSEKLTDFACAPGDDVEIPDHLLHHVPNHAPQLVKGPAPEPVVSSVPPPPKDPKKASAAGK